jgi:protein SCO1/2
MRPRQTLLLGLLLLVPVLAFLFLNNFGTNHYALPFLLPDRVDSTRNAAGEWQRDTVFHQVRPFRLLTSTGRALSSAELGKGFYVAQFYDADAPSVLASRQLLRVQEKYRQETRVRILSFVRNPGLTPLVKLQQLAEQYGTVAGKWYFLTGSADTMQTLYHQEFRYDVPYHRSIQGHPVTVQPAPGRLLLLDRDQHLRGVYDGRDGRETDRLLTEIDVLLYSYDHDD